MNLASNNSFRVEKKKKKKERLWKKTIDDWKFNLINLNAWEEVGPLCNW